MNRVASFSDGSWRRHSWEDFEDRFFDTCEAHRAQGRALAFALILADREHPYVRSVLENQAYWDSLDDLAGQNLSVFCFDVRSRPPERIEFDFCRANWGRIYSYGSNL